MWNTRCANSIVEKRAKQISHVKHLKSLKKVRSVINNKQTSRSVIINKQKTRQLEDQRQEDINNKNFYLVQRMKNIIPTIKNINVDHNRFRAISQSNPYKKRKQQQIEDGNERMIRLISNATSCNRHNNLLQFNNYIRYRKNAMNSTNSGSSIYDASFLLHRAIRSFSARSRLSNGSRR